MLGIKFARLLRDTLTITDPTNMSIHRRRRDTVCQCDTSEQSHFLWSCILGFGRIEKELILWTDNLVVGDVRYIEVYKSSETWIRFGCSDLIQN